MIGVSLAMADKWILAHYAAADNGAITLLTNAKSLFNAPLSVIGMAAGAASLPFFSSLFAQNRLADFNSAVNTAVSRLIAVSLLVTAWMVALAVPIVGFLRGGSYTHADALATARYFALFALSLALWSAQGIYARAFYAARNTLTPAISGTVVTCVSIPIYALLFHHIGVNGLAIASDIGIFAHTLALAVLLHRYRLVSLACLNFAELARALAAAMASFAAAAACLRFLQVPARMTNGCVRFLHVSADHAQDSILLSAGTFAWLALCVIVLVATGSNLPAQILRRNTA
jgi:putative peptidoglycan lipid II flippase